MSIFSEIAERNIKCEICGAATKALYAGGFGRDLIYCTNDDCGAEYKFPTSTEEEIKDE